MNTLPVPKRGEEVEPVEENAAASVEGRFDWLDLPDGVVLRGEPRLIVSKDFPFPDTARLEIRLELSDDFLIQAMDPENSETLFGGIVRGAKFFPVSFQTAFQTGVPDNVVDVSGTVVYDEPVPPGRVSSDLHWIPLVGSSRVALGASTSVWHGDVLFLTPGSSVLAHMLSPDDEVSHDPWAAAPLPPRLHSQDLRNVERRRTVLEELTRELGAESAVEMFLRTYGNRIEIVDEDGAVGRLLKIDGWFAFVEVRDSTNREKTYHLRVPPGVSNVRQAVAWTFGLTQDQYEPEVET